MELITILGTDDTEDLYIQIPEQIIEQLGWHEGTEIDWQIKDNSIVITKVKNSVQSQQESKHPFNIIKEEIKLYLESESKGKDYIYT
jgi:antitoxin component of MazEF toxin-antitoxin module